MLRLKSQRPERSNRIPAQIAGPKRRGVAVVVGHRRFDRQRQRLLGQGTVRVVLQVLGEQPTGAHRIVVDAERAHTGQDGLGLTLLLIC